MDVKTLIFFTITNLVTELAKASAENEGIVTFQLSDIQNALIKLREQNVLPYTIVDELILDLGIIFADSLMEIGEEHSRTLSSDLSVLGS